VSETVTVGVPVFRGQSFVGEALSSIQAQTHDDLRVIVSLDGPDAACERVCRPFLADPRFRLTIQPENLGWAGNVSWLMQQIATPFWCCLPQDDLIRPRYLERLVAHARSAPEAAIVYCDIEAFGDLSATLSEPSLTGSPVTRQLSLLVERYAAVAFRGLTRAEALRGAGRVPTNSAGHFSVDTAWVAATARYGEHHRVPEALYRKRYHGGGVHGDWWRWSDARRERAWVVHCADMLEQAMAVPAQRDQRRMLWGAAAGRVVSGRASPAYLSEAPLSRARHRRLLRAFVDHVRDERDLDLPALLGARWRTISRWARDLSPAGA